MDNTLCKAVLFDFDGVIVDTEGQYSLFWNKIGQDYLGDPAFGDRVKGQTLTYIYDAFFPDPQVRPALTEALVRYEEQMTYDYVPGILNFLADLRRRLGLSPGPSPLKWRETLPYLPLLALICVAAPLLARWVDGTFVVDVPVFSGLLFPFAVLPAAGFCSGFSLGRREGFCPLYPLAGGLLYVPVALIAYNHTALFHSLLFALPALAGNAAGGAWRRVKRK